MKAGVLHIIAGTTVASIQFSVFFFQHVQDISH